MSDNHCGASSPSVGSNSSALPGDVTAGAMLAMRLFALPEVQRVKKDLRDCFFVPRAPSDNPEVMSTLDGAMDELTFAAMLAVAGADKLNPILNLYESMPYSALGQRVSGSRYGFDNPDRAFRHFFVNPAFRYELRGRRPPACASTNLLIEACEDKAPGWGYPLTFLRLENIETDSNGNFVISVDSAPRPDETNHLWLPPGAAHVLIRDTYLDWSRELPTELSVRRISGPPSAPAMSFDTMAKLAPLQVMDYAMNGFKWYDLALAQVPVNTIPMPQIRPAPPGEKPWGMTGVGRFGIADDEAMVFTVLPQTSRYLGIMIATPWLVSINYENHTSCLNISQAACNPDGSITCVVAARDPGVQNWLDTGGIHEGVMLLRWEMVERALDPSSAVRDVKMVKLRDLDSSQPLGQPTMSADQRRNQIAVRRAGYQKRMRALLGPSAEQPSHRISE